MGDPEKASIPAWQQSQSQSQSQTNDAPENSSAQETDATTEVTIDQARKFLKDEAVRKESSEKKAEFLKSKGLDDAQIQQLLEETEQDTQASSSHPTTDESKKEDKDKKQDTEGNKDVGKTVSATVSSSASEPAPIITYPEFLTTSPKPPPLITPSRLANILTISGSVWALLYGTARFVVSPMVDTLSDARTDYYAHVSGKLEQLVEELEGAVSEVPYKNGKLLKSKQDEDGYDDDESTFSDPTELFHRDIGTQTSPLVLAQDYSSGGQTDKPIDAQMRRLSALRASLREMNDMHVRHAEDAADLNSLLRDVREEVDKLGAAPMMDFSSIHGGLGYGRSAEPDDEVKRTKDAIRSVKGMFLSARSFPTTAAR